MNKDLPVNAQRGDIQALLRSGFAQLRACRFWLLRIDEPRAAQAWLQGVLERGLVHSAGQIDEASRTRRRLRETVALAFSHAGLATLGLREDADFPFPTPFASGMGSAVRAGILRDGDRGHWHWSDAGDAGTPKALQVHVLAIHYSELPGDGAPGEPFATALPSPSAEHGFRVLAVDSCPSFIQADANGSTVSYEPFGFRDALAQPEIRDLRDTEGRSDAPPPDDRLIAPGEFILGHRNQYGELTYCPDASGWAAAGGNTTRFGFNGSYLAVRQIEQAIESFAKLHAEGSGTARPTVAEKMIGRRRDDAGTPLWWPKNSPADIDDFRFRAADAPGFHCPRGAHIRRANPRDTLGHDVSTGLAAAKLHRLLRRGRPYRGAQPACAGDAARCGSDACRRAGCAEGIVFVALNADLDRQFEFIQQRWIADTGFGDVAGQSDPLVGGKNTVFSIPGLPCGAAHRHVSDYTRTLGGGYFFLPGLAALRFLAARPLPEALAAAGRAEAALPAG